MSLAAKVLKGDVPAAARLITLIEDESPDAFAEMESLYPHTGRAYIIGVTGAPGVGKSTLTDCLIASFRGKKMSVGVIAIDPTSALTGGALLGDRIRMQRHAADPAVFIRSLATRGWVGGLAKAAIGAARVMDALGKDVILVETVGSGQVELDIVKAADTTLLVLAPGAGDEIQAMKAGILESADVIAVNKADKEGADRLKTDLEAMLAMRPRPESGWPVPLVLTEAVNDKGIKELSAALMKHRDYLQNSGELLERRRERVKLELLETIKGQLKDMIQSLDTGDSLEKLVEAILQGKTTPRRAARAMIERLKNG
ncbi:MAG: methylmalonyl Co-A mutase-associated GTPase MeaB [Dehalococcoidales bacterium]|jgi:LAO/AO transport system kinase